MLVGFVREHIEIIRPPRALWLNFPMGRPMGKPNDPAYQSKVIRSAFDLLDASSGPVVEDYVEVIPVVEGRMSYALPAERVYTLAEIGNVDNLLTEVQVEIESIRSDYDAAVDSRGRTTVSASELEISQLAPYIAAFVKNQKPESPREGLSPVPLLKLVIEDLQAYYTETWTHREGIDDFEALGQRFWEETKAGQLILWLETTARQSDDQVLRQLVELWLLTPRYWAEEVPPP